MTNLSSSCSQCTRKRRFIEKRPLGILSVVILAILPKCPFCVLAYSSTVLLCAKDGILSSSSTLHNSALSIAFVSVFGLITISSIGFNFKGRRTVLSLILAVPGLAASMLSVMYAGGEIVYYTGVIFLFLSVWANGSLPWLIGTFRRNGNVPIYKMVR